MMYIPLNSFPNISLAASSIKLILLVCEEEDNREKNDHVEQNFKFLDNLISLL